MPADRMLGTLLRALQTHTDQQDTARLFGTAASLLTTLQNPLNITLLASQLLSAPAIWIKPDAPQTCTRCMSVFHSAAQALLRHESEAFDSDTKVSQQPDKPHLERTLPKNDWIRAVVKGADDHCPQWRHLLLIGGLLLGFGPAEEENLQNSLRSMLNEAFVDAVNLAVEFTGDDDELGQLGITLALNHTFPLLSDAERSRIQYDSLLPVLMRNTFHSQEGLQSGYFMSIIDLDVYKMPQGRLHWAERSPSFHKVNAMTKGPLTAALGPLARLIGYSIENVRDASLAIAALADLEAFAKTIHLQYRQCKLSAVDTSDEQQLLDQQTANTTVPVLWKLLRSTLFATVIVVRSILGRTLGDRALADDKVAPHLATQALHLLRYTYFISNRLGAGTFSQYDFVYYTAIDILSTYPTFVETLINTMRPHELREIPSHALDRNLDLFFLNTSENFTLVLPPTFTEENLISAAVPYIAAGGDPKLMPIFEAAHSLTLAVFCAPQNADLANQHMTFYVDALFAAFPRTLSSRQFRLAFKTLIRITSAPAPLAARHPMLPAILLELLNEQAKHASSTPLPVQPPVTGVYPSNEPIVPLSEQAVLVLTVIDALTQLSLDLLDEWLPLTAELIHLVGDATMREHCKTHFWAVLIDGEMDPERSQVAHAWWTTAGGREYVLYGREADGGVQRFEMSGALLLDELSKL